MLSSLLNHMVFIIAVIIAAIIVMVFHEFSKTFVYALYMKKEKLNYKQYSFFKFWKYIDPIGVILAVVGCGIFSKQYPYLIKSKRAAIGIGLTGYLSMFLLAIMSTISYNNFLTFLKINSYLNLGDLNQHYMLLAVGFLYILQYTAIFSMTMIGVNLFPLTSFDISLILAGCAPNIFSKIRKYDAVLKLLFMIILNRA